MRDALRTWVLRVQSRVGVGCLAIGVTAQIAAPVAAATRYDPTLRFQTITTPHFVIYFHQGEEALAERLASITERVHGALVARMGARPRGRTHVILVDQTDRANGWASPLPYNLVEVTAAWPEAGDLIGNTDDWLTLVFSHEYAHILHLDRSGGWAGVVRRLFGRTPFAFPNLFLPLWQVEGIATFEETAITGQGRIPSGDFRAIVDTAASVGRLEPLDRVNGGLVDWPSGSAHYAYGAYFHRYLASRFGEASLTALSDRTAGRVPYVSSPAFKSVFGHSLGQLWSDFEQSWASIGKDLADGAAGRRVTHHGFFVEGPRFDPRDPAGQTVFYSVQNPDGFPRILRVNVLQGDPVPVTSRVGGGRLGVGADALVFDQLELTRNVALYGDLYSVDRVTGETRRLTSGLRLSDPDLAPDGRSLVCVVAQPGRRALAVIDLPIVANRAPTLLLSEPDTQFDGPRWSPDGRRIAAQRRRLGGPSELVLIDPLTRQAHVVVASNDGRTIDPSWTPDGGTLLFASNHDGGPFNIFAADLSNAGADRDSPDSLGEVPLYQVTHLPTGAAAPDVSPDGRTLVYVGYTRDGYDLFTLPLDRGAWRRVTRFSAEARAPGPPMSIETHRPASVRSYAPWRTLLPRLWFPIVEADGDQVSVGASTAGTDALGRHAYAVAAEWSVSAPEDLRRARRGRPDWSAYYAYDRWRPTLFASASEDSSLVRDARRSVSSPQLLRLRERKVSAGVYLPFRQVRHSQAFLGAFNYERHAFDPEALVSPLNRSAVRAGWSFNTAKSYGYSISREEGVAGTITSEHVRALFGADGRADSVTGDVRGFVRLGHGHDILALRGAAGVAGGDQRVRRSFDLGGRGSDALFFDFGRDALGLLRGFGQSAFSGSRIALINIDYRFPLLRLERGRGTLPFFARTLHASLFADAGNAWTARFERRAIKTAVGAELSLDLTAAYVAPLTCVAGAAWGRDGQTGASQIAGYVRFGRAF